MKTALETAGWMSELEINKLTEICHEALMKKEDIRRAYSMKALPINILEIGSFLGRSSLTWAESISHFHENLKRDYTLYAKVVCVDPWVGNLLDFPDGSIQTLDGDRTNIEYLVYSLYDSFIKNTCSHGMIYPVRKYSNEFKWLFAERPDIIFIDGDHSPTSLTNDLYRSLVNAEFGALKETVIVGHDFNHPHIQHITPIVKQFAEKHGYVLSNPTDTSLFMLRKL